MYHLCFYSMPKLQRYVLRILFIVPVYSLLSAASLKLGQPWSAYLETGRDCYEAWIIYNFVALLYRYAGGAVNVARIRGGGLLHPSLLHGTCCLPRVPLGEEYLKWCKRLTLQFVVLKPLLSFATIGLQHVHLYGEGAYRFDRGRAPRPAPALLCDRSPLDVSSLTRTLAATCTCTSFITRRTRRPCTAWSCSTSPRSTCCAPGAPS